MSPFFTRTTGKWILAGEHAVLRGSPALVFPLESSPLTLSCEEGEAGGELQLRLGGKYGAELQLLFWGVLEKACELKKVSRSFFSGKVNLSSEIPVGAGLGASAALCVAMSQWFAHLKVIGSSEVADFSRTLENLFHGESSGVDIAVAIAGQPLKFYRGQAPEVLSQRRWTPRLYVSYSGQRGMTLECVNQVKALIERDSSKGAELDGRMKEAVLLCEKALLLDEKDGGFELLSKGLSLASSCFEEWGLTEGPVQTHMNYLRAKGALAVKPTGSGRGGYVLSLWGASPTDEIAKDLIPCFQSL